MRIVPLTSDGAYRFNIELNGIVYTFEIKYNVRFNTWSFSMLQNEIDVITGVGMLIGVNMLEPFTLDNIGGLYMFDDSGQKLDAGPDDLGTRVIMIYLTPQEVIENVI